MPIYCRETRFGQYKATYARWRYTTERQGLGSTKPLTPDGDILQRDKVWAVQSHLRPMPINCRETRFGQYKATYARWRYTAERQGLGSTKSFTADADILQRDKVWAVQSHLRPMAIYCRETRMLTFNLEIKANFYKSAHLEFFFFLTVLNLQFSQKPVSAALWLWMNEWCCRSLFTQIRLNLAEGELNEVKQNLREACSRADLVIRLSTRHSDPLSLRDNHLPIGRSVATCWHTSSTSNTAPLHSYSVKPYKHMEFTSKHERGE